MVFAALAVVLVMSLTVGAFAAEIGIPTDRPDLAVIAAQFVNWDGSYELPNLNELSEEDQELVRAMVNAAMVASEAEAQTGAQTEDGMETQAQTQAIPADVETAPVTDDELLPAVTGFSDVPRTHGFYTAIMDCAAKGITSGYADGTFRPTNSVTRAQFCVMLSRAFYPNEVKKYDTEEYKKVWFGPNTKALSAAGVLTRTSFQYAYNTSRAMDQVINRYDMATLMTNIMAKKGFSATATQKTEAQKKIADYKSIPSQYQDAVKNVFALGIITGYSDGTFGGERVMNRGQGCVVIYRMMKYTPATTPGTGNTGTGDTYDDGKTKPGTSTGSGSTSTGNTGTNSGSTGTSTNTDNTNKTGILANGKAITEANVLAMIQELLKKYPAGMTWNDNTTRTGTVSQALNTIKNNYYVANTRYRPSMTAGCGGFASLISDSIFGSGNANPTRKVPLECVRPGDVIMELDANGKLKHIAIAASRITGIDKWTDNISPVITTYDGNNGDHICYDTAHTIPKTPNNTNNYYCEVWTRYPADNTTPWTGSSSSGSTGNTGTGSTGNTGSTTTVNWITSNNPCGVCGKTGGQQVRSADGARYVCRTCYEDPSGIGKWFVE